MKLHVDDGYDGKSTTVALTLVKTTTQLYGLPHAKAEVKSCLFDKMRTQVVIGWFSNQSYAGRVHWLWIWDGELRTTKYCWGGNSS